MFSATMSNVKTMRDSIDTISQLIDEGLFNIKPDGLELVATDRAMVAVIDFKLASSSFDNYEFEKETSMALNLINLLTILKRASNNDKLIMQLDEENSKLKLKIEGSYTRSFYIPLLEINADDIPPISQLDFPASATLDSSIISQGISDADIIADSVIIKLTPEGFSMNAEGDSSKTKLDIGKDVDVLSELNVKEDVQARYPLDYLKKIIKASRLADTAKIQMGNDYPMKIEFKGEGVSMSMVIAPRVSEE